MEEAKSRIAEYEGTIAKLRSQLKHTEKDKKDKIDMLTKTLKEKEEKLKILEGEFEGYKKSKDDEKLELSSLRSQLIGMMECWNIGMLVLENWG